MLNSIWEAKPNCIGEPLKPEQFSNDGDVGFIKDVCVDIVARNFYNSLGFPVSQTCEELVTNEIISKAEALMKELLDSVANNPPEETNMNAGEFVYDRVKDAQRRLIDSEAVSEDSQIMGIMEDMKIFLCKHCAISDNKDMANAIHLFKSDFEAQIRTRMLNPRVEDTVAQATITGLFRLSFDYKNGADIWTGSVIIKIPSLAPFYNTRWRRTAMYKREADFYGLILPALYQMGNCDPFAPKLYARTEGCALVLEDLSISGHESPPRLVSLDLDHSRIFIHMLAQYHALGHIYFKNLEEDNPIKQLIGPHQNIIRRAISKDEFDNLCEMVKPLLTEDLYKKILRAEDKILAKLPIQNEYEPNSINVIMHGDLHRKNFLFKYDFEGKVIGVKLLDWQIGTVGSPALDLIEFFVHNLHEEVFQANEDNLLEYYLTTFNQNLSYVQSNRVYTRFELNRDMAFFKYYFFRVLSDTIVYWGAKHGPEYYNLIAENIRKWMVYLEMNLYI